MKISVTHAEPHLPGWLHVHPSEMDSLPDKGEPILRIYAGWVLEQLDVDLVGLVMHSWRDHPQVTSRTLLAITGDRTASRNIYMQVRNAGWGIALPYPPGYLTLDRWPLVDPLGEQFAALCRPIK